VAVPASADLIDWLRNTCDAYTFDIAAVYRREGRHEWPLAATDADDLAAQLAAGGHFLPLPKEPAALANVLEVSLVDFVLERAAEVDGLEARRGTERGYPDVELSGSAFGGGYHALDVKIARRASGGRRTQSRITLYTGNTYFRYPQLRWPGTFRPFRDYASHVDLLGIYTLTEATERVADLELIVQEPWRIASTQRSSTTREYIGAVQTVADLRDGRGEFATEAEFYRYWRRFNFRIGRAVQQVLDRLLAEQDSAQS
jgi:restriction endonuclease EcoRV